MKTPVWHLAFQMCRVLVLRTYFLSVSPVLRSHVKFKRSEECQLSSKK